MCVADITAQLVKIEKTADDEDHSKLTLLLELKNEPKVHTIRGEGACENLEKELRAYMYSGGGRNEPSSASCLLRIKFKLDFKALAALSVVLELDEPVRMCSVIS